MIVGMSATVGQGHAGHLAFESSGVRLRLDADSPELLERMRELLPPDAEPTPNDHVQESFGLVQEGNGYTYTRDGHPVSSDLDLEFALTLIQTQVRLYIGLNAPNRIFIHAGAVAHNGRAIVIPGRSFTGKTSLVGAFLRAGAVYYSDEFAVLDEQALVHPYLTPLSFRLDGDQREDVSPAALGSTAGNGPIPIGAFVLTQYRPGASWAPETLSRGRAALDVLDNALAALKRHEEILPVLRRATEGVIVLKGERGEPEEVVADVFRRLESTDD